MWAFLRLYATQSHASTTAPSDPPAYITTSQRGADEIWRRFTAEAETSRKPRYTAPACAFRVENFLQLGFCAIHPVRPRQHWGQDEKQQLHAVQMISVNFSWLAMRVRFLKYATPDMARVHHGLRDFLRNGDFGLWLTKNIARPVMARG